jgi:hypothetical protein
MYVNRLPNFGYISPPIWIIDYIKEPLLCQPFFYINTNHMDNTIFDFGFTLVDEDELEAVQHIKAEAEAINESSFDLQDRLDNLYNAIQPLLNNLKSKPEKEYILWPNRLEKIEEFETHIQNIYKGN